MAARAAERRTGWVWDERFTQHDASLDLGAWVEPGPMFETPAGKQRIASLVAATGLIDQLTALSPDPIDRDDLERVHDPAYVDRVASLSSTGGGPAGDYCHVGPGSYEIALLAAGGTYAALRAVLEGRADNAYALVRPAGHHAEPGRGRGYCVFSNLGVAIHKARAELGMGRVAVVDWDVHHGNGTEAIFADDPEVLTVSIHQDRLYPGDTGDPLSTGSPAAPGTSVNVALPPGSGWGAYEHALHRVVAPAVRAFRPDVLLVANGFDAGSFDPMGRMLLSSAAFGRLAEFVRQLAEELCQGRVMLSHEGGYSELHVPFCGLAVLEALSGARTGVEDPFAWVEADPHQTLTTHQAEAVTRTVEAHRGFTDLTHST